MFLLAAESVGLAALYQCGRMQTIVAGVLFTASIVILLVWQSENRFVGIVIGVLLWALLGEITEHLGWSDIICVKNAFLLLTTAVFVAYLVYKDALPSHILIAAVLFVTIWAFHFVQANLFEYAGKTHPLTYASSLLFPLVLAFAVWGARTSKNPETLTIQCILIAGSFWAILEYLWAWKWIPKRW
jgi:hypothetical protein